MRLKYWTQGRPQKQSELKTFGVQALDSDDILFILTDCLLPP